MSYNTLIELLCSERGFSIRMEKANVYYADSLKNDYSKAFEHIDSAKGVSTNLNFYTYVKDIPTFEEDFIEFKNMIFEKGMKGVLVGSPKFLEKISKIISSSYRDFPRENIMDIPDIAAIIVDGSDYMNKDNSRSLMGHMMFQFSKFKNNFDKIVKGQTYSAEYEENKIAEYVEVKNRLDFRLITNYIRTFERRNNINSATSFLEAYKYVTYKNEMSKLDIATYTEPIMVTYNENKRISMIKAIMFLESHYHKINIENYKTYEARMSRILAETKITDKANDFTRAGFSAIIKAYVALRNIDVSIFSLENNFFTKHEQDSEYYTTIKQFKETRNLKFPDMPEDPEIIPNTEFIFEYLRDNIKIDFTKVYPGVVTIKPFDQIISEVKEIKQLKKIEPAEPLDIEIIADFLNDYKPTIEKYSAEQVSAILDRNSGVLSSLNLEKVTFTRTHRGYIFSKDNEFQPIAFNDNMARIISDRENEIDMINAMSDGNGLIDINKHNFYAVKPLNLETSIRKYNKNLLKKMNEELGLAMLQRESPDFSKSVESVILKLEKSVGASYTSSVIQQILELNKEIRVKYNLAPSTPINRNGLIVINGEYLSGEHNGYLCFLTESGNLVKVSEDKTVDIDHTIVMTSEELHSVFT